MKSVIYSFCLIHTIQVYYFYYYYIILLGKGDSSIVVCITPLTSIMLDQHTKFSVKGLRTDFVGEAQSDPKAEQREFVMDFHSWCTLAQRV